MNGGVTYIRWGKTTCPNIHGTSLVYDGYTAGTHYSKSAGGANIICLPKVPQYHNEANAANTGDSELHGAEYQIWGDRYLRGHHDRNVPCAVCEVSTRSKHLMIPALYDCPTGWTEEYDGWLVAERTNHELHKGRNTYSCIDKTLMSYLACMVTKMVFYCNQLRQYVMEFLVLLMTIIRISPVWCAPSEPYKLYKSYLHNSKRK